MEIKQNQYLYGSYELDKKDSVIIYYEILSSNTATIGSLEGLFVSIEPLIKKGEEVNSGWELIIKRNEMQEFEEKYKGEFKPFMK